MTDIVMPQTINHKEQTMREAAYIHGPFDCIVAQATLDDDGTPPQALALPDVYLTNPQRITEYVKLVPIVDDVEHYDGRDIAMSLLHNKATREPVGLDDMPTHEQMLNWDGKGFYVLVWQVEPGPLVYHWFDKERRFNGNWPDGYA